LRKMTGEALTTNRLGTPELLPEFRSAENTIGGKSKTT